VYEDKILSLSELVETLKNDWKDREPLRLLVKNKYPKYGQGNKKTDAIAKKIVDVLSDAVSYKENVRGGNWRLGLFSIDWRWQFGEKTAASADGRRSGETVSQNTSASFGADKEGATAHLISGASIDTTKTPNGAILDIDLHSSAVNGENGIKALLTSLKTYFDLGGFAVQYNIMDTEILKDAKINPEKYPSLQVRLCGWNVLFSSLSEKEKDEFIARSIK
jgi:formate C-acetyltransferase